MSRKYSGRRLFALLIASMNKILEWRRRKFNRFRIFLTEKNESRKSNGRRILPENFSNKIIG